MRHAAAAFLFLVLTASRICAQEGYYLEYETFRALTALVPDAADPGLANLTDGGFQLWAAGQMRLPAVGHLVEGDFNSDGLPDAALVFRSRDHWYLLIASRTQGQWARQALLELQGEAQVALEGAVLIVSSTPKTFVAWDGHQYRMASELPAVPAKPDSGKNLVTPLSNPPTPSESVPFGFFTQMDTQDLKSVSIRLSYLGPQEELISDLAFVPQGGSMAQKRSFVWTITVPSVLLKQLLDALQGPVELSGAPKPYPFLSLTVEKRDADHIKSFQKIFNTEDAKKIFSVFRLILESHRPARPHVQSWGCALDLLPEGSATDVTGRVNIKITNSSGSPWDQVSNFIQHGRAPHSDIKVAVTNRSAAALEGPVSVAFNLSGNARALDVDGATCHVTPVGRGFIDLPLRNGRLLPGETVEMPVGIENPENEPVTFDIKILAGPDPR